MACLFLHICLVAFFSFDFSGAASNSGVPGSDTSTPSPEHFYSHPSLFDAYVDLQDNILNRTVVRKKVPAIISNYTTKTYLFFEPYQILSVDDEEQTVSMKTTLDLFWLDQNLMWEPGDYLGLDSLQVASSQVWTPRIGMAEDVENDEFKMPASVLIYSNGEVYVFLPGRVKFLCFLDMEFFPFDEHECKLSFLADSWNLHNYLGDEYDLTKHFAASSEWTLLSFDCIDSENPVASAQIVICSIRMRRRSTFYVINIVVPMLLTSVMTLVVFLLPAESGEKMSFLVSLYVSTSVFLNFMVDFLPRSMDKVPRINLLLIALLVKLILATLATVWVKARYNKHLARATKKRKMDIDADSNTLSAGKRYKSQAVFRGLEKNEGSFDLGNNFVHFEKNQITPQRQGVDERFCARDRDSIEDTLSVEEETRSSGMTSSVSALWTTSELKGQTNYGPAQTITCPSRVRRLVYEAGRRLGTFCSSQSDELSHTQLDRVMLSVFFFVTIVMYVTLLC